MKKSLLILAIYLSTHIMATNLAMHTLNGGQQSIDISTIGKWIYQGENIVLVSTSGEVLATESIANLKKITFEASRVSTGSEETSIPSIRIYPNQTQNILIIEGIEVQTIRVYDMQGKLISTQQGTQINIGNLSQGTYLLQKGVQLVKFIKH